MTSIGYGAFNGCNSLGSIKVGTENSKYDSRNGCNAIIETASNTLIRGCKNTIIPNTVTGIGESAFESCSGLARITIPNSVTSIGDYAFEGCSLTSVNYNATNCITMGQGVFLGCSSLIINIGDNVQTIPNSAFRNCSGLTSVTIGNSVTSIGEYTFSGCI